MSEYEARLKSFANNVTEIRSATGATPSTLMFAMMSIMLAKNKITENLTFRVWIVYWWCRFERNATNAPRCGPGCERRCDSRCHYGDRDS